MTDPAHTTTTSMLEALRDPNEQRAWFELDRRIRPLIEACVRSMGLAAEEAEEAGQRAMAEAVRAYRDGKYQRQRGRLRSWFIGIARRQGLAVLAARGRGSAGLSAAEEQSDPDRLADIWDAELQRRVLREAWESLPKESKFDERTLRAFDLFVMRRVPAEETARQCGITADEVYVAKHRVGRRLEELARRVRETYEQEE